MFKKIFTTLFLYLIFIQNCFAWDNLYSYNPFKKQANTAQQGTMTGYSVPVNNDIFKKLKLDNNQSAKSPTCATELFSSPVGNSGYSRSNSKKEKTGGGVGSSTGVTIIYD